MKRGREGPGAGGSVADYSSVNGVLVDLYYLALLDAVRENDEEVLEKVSRAFEELVKERVFSDELTARRAVEVFRSLRRMACERLGGVSVEVIGGLLKLLKGLKPKGSGSTGVWDELRKVLEDVVFECTRLPVSLEVLGKGKVEAEGEAKKEAKTREKTGKARLKDLLEWAEKSYDGRFYGWVVKSLERDGVSLKKLEKQLKWLNSVISKPLDFYEWCERERSREVKEVGNLDALLGLWVLYKLDGSNLEKLAKGLEREGWIGRVVGQVSLRAQELLRERVEGGGKGRAKEGESDGVFAASIWLAMLAVVFARVLADKESGLKLLEKLASLVKRRGVGDSIAKVDEVGGRLGDKLTVVKKVAHHITSGLLGNEEFKQMWRFLLRKEEDQSPGGSRQQPVGERG